MPPFLIRVLFVLAVVALIARCDPYQRVLKGDDMEVKEQMARQYYNEADYYKAIGLMEQLISVYRGTRDVTDIYYYYCYSHFGQQNYMMAAYHFKRFAETYHKDDRVEEAHFMYAYCYYILSPRPSLDQRYTYKAIDAFQLFVNRYPYSERVETCNQYIDNLRKKLHRKSFAAARLYYKTRRYKAATVALSNVLEDYPEIDNQDEVRFLALKSNYKLAQNSIAKKQPQRYRQTIEVYQSYQPYLKGSEYQEDARKIYQSSLKALEKQ